MMPQDDLFLEDDSPLRNPVVWIEASQPSFFPLWVDETMYELNKHKIQHTGPDGHIEHRHEAEYSEGGWRLPILFDAPATTTITADTDGYCYLRFFEPTHQEAARKHLGSYPTLRRIIGYIKCVQKTDKSIKLLTRQLSFRVTPNGLVGHVHSAPESSGDFRGYYLSDDSVLDVPLGEAADYLQYRNPQHMVNAGAAECVDCRGEISRLSFQRGKSLHLGVGKFVCSICNGYRKQKANEEKQRRETGLPALPKQWCLACRCMTNPAGTCSVTKVGHKYKNNKPTTTTIQAVSPRRDVKSASEELGNATPLVRVPVFPVDALTRPEPETERERIRRITKYGRVVYKHKKGKCSGKSINGVYPARTEEVPVDSVDQPTRTTGCWRLLCPELPECPTLRELVAACNKRDIDWKGLNLWLDVEGNTLHLDIVRTSRQAVRMQSTWMLWGLGKLFAGEVARVNGLEKRWRWCHEYQQWALAGGDSNCPVHKANKRKGYQAAACRIPDDVHYRYTTSDAPTNRRPSSPPPRYTQAEYDAYIKSEHLRINKGLGICDCEWCREAEHAAKRVTASPAITAVATSESGRDNLWPEEASIPIRDNKKQATHGRRGGRSQAECEQCGFKMLSDKCKESCGWSNYGIDVSPQIAAPNCPNCGEAIGSRECAFQCNADPDAYQTPPQRGPLPEWPHQEEEELPAMKSNAEVLRDDLKAVCENQFEVAEDGFSVSYTNPGNTRKIQDYIKDNIHETRHGRLLVAPCGLGKSKFAPGLLMKKFGFRRVVMLTERISGTRSTFDWYKERGLEGCRGGKFRGGQKDDSFGSKEYSDDIKVMTTGAFVSEQNRLYKNGPWRIPSDTMVLLDECHNLTAATLAVMIKVPARNLIRTSASPFDEGVRLDLQSPEASTITITTAPVTKETVWQSHSEADPNQRWAALVIVPTVDQVNQVAHYLRNTGARILKTTGKGTEEFNEDLEVNNPISDLAKQVASSDHVFVIATQVLQESVTLDITHVFDFGKRCRPFLDVVARAEQFQEPPPSKQVTRRTVLDLCGAQEVITNISAADLVQVCGRVGRIAGRPPGQALVHLESVADLCPPEKGFSDEFNFLAQAGLNMYGSRELTPNQLTCVKNFLAKQISNENVDHRAKWFKQLLEAWGIQPGMKVCRFYIVEQARHFIKTGKFSLEALRRVNPDEAARVSKRLGFWGGSSEGGNTTRTDSGASSPSSNLPEPSVYALGETDVPECPELVYTPGSTDLEDRPYYGLGDTNVPNRPAEPTKGGIYKSRGVEVTLTPVGSKPPTPFADRKPALYVPPRRQSEPYPYTKEEEDAQHFIDIMLDRTQDWREAWRIWAAESILAFWRACRRARELKAASEWEIISYDEVPYNLDFIEQAIRWKQPESPELVYELHSTNVPRRPRTRVNKKGRLTYAISAVGHSAAGEVVVGPPGPLDLPCSERCICSRVAPTPRGKGKMDHNTVERLDSELEEWRDSVRSGDHVRATRPKPRSFMLGYAKQSKGAGRQPAVDRVTPSIRVEGEATSSQGVEVTLTPVVNSTSTSTSQDITETRHEGKRRITAWSAAWFLMMGYLGITRDLSPYQRPRSSFAMDPSNIALLRSAMQPEVPEMRASLNRLLSCILILQGFIASQSLDLQKGLWSFAYSDKEVYDRLQLLLEIYWQEATARREQHYEKRGYDWNAVVDQADMGFKPEASIIEIPEDEDVWMGGSEATTSEGDRVTPSPVCEPDIDCAVDSEMPNGVDGDRVTPSPVVTESVADDAPRIGVSVIQIDQGVWVGESLLTELDHALQCDIPRVLIHSTVWEGRQGVYSVCTCTSEDRGDMSVATLLAMGRKTYKAFIKRHPGAPTWHQLQDEHLLWQEFRYGFIDKQANRLNGAIYSSLLMKQRRVDEVKLSTKCKPFESKPLIERPDPALVLGHLAYAWGRNPLTSHHVIKPTTTDKTNRLFHRLRTMSTPQLRRLRWVAERDAYKSKIARGNTVRAGTPTPATDGYCWLQAIKPEYHQQLGRERNRYIKWKRFVAIPAHMKESGNYSVDQVTGSLRHLRLDNVYGTPVHTWVLPFSARLGSAQLNEVERFILDGLQKMVASQGPAKDEALKVIRGLCGHDALQDFETLATTPSSERPGAIRVAKRLCQHGEIPRSASLQERPGKNRTTEYLFELGWDPAHKWLSPTLNDIVKKRDLDFVAPTSLPVNLSSTAALFWLINLGVQPRQIEEWISKEGKPAHWNIFIFENQVKLECLGDKSLWFDSVPTIPEYGPPPDRVTLTSYTLNHLVWEHLWQGTLPQDWHPKEAKECRRFCGHQHSDFVRSGALTRACRDECVKYTTRSGHSSVTMTQAEINNACSLPHTQADLSRLAQQTRLGEEVQRLEREVNRLGRELAQAQTTVSSPSEQDHLTWLKAYCQNLSHSQVTPLCGALKGLEETMRARIMSRGLKLSTTDDHNEVLRKALSYLDNEGIQRALKAFPPSQVKAFAGPPSGACSDKTAHEDAVPARALARRFKVTTKQLPKTIVDLEIRLQAAEDVIDNVKPRVDPLRSEVTKRAAESIKSRGNTGFFKKIRQAQRDVVLVAPLAVTTDKPPPPPVAALFRPNFLSRRYNQSEVGFNLAGKDYYIQGKFDIAYEDDKGRSIWRPERRLPCEGSFLTASWNLLYQASFLVCPKDRPILLKTLGLSAEQLQRIASKDDAPCMEFSLLKKKWDRASTKPSDPGPPSEQSLDWEVAGYDVLGTLASTTAPLPNELLEYWADGKLQGSIKRVGRPILFTTRIWLTPGPVGEPTASDWAGILFGPMGAFQAGSFPTKVNQTIVDDLHASQWEEAVRDGTLQACTTKGWGRGRSANLRSEGAARFPIDLHGSNYPRMRASNDTLYGCIWRDHSLAPALYSEILAALKSVQAACLELIADNQGWLHVKTQAGHPVHPQAREFLLPTHPLFDYKLGSAMLRLIVYTLGRPQMLITNDRDDASQVSLQTLQANHSPWGAVAIPYMELATTGTEPLWSIEQMATYWTNNWDRYGADAFAIAAIGVTAPCETGWFIYTAFSKEGSLGAPIKLSDGRLAQWDWPAILKTQSPGLIQQAMAEVVPASAFRHPNALVWGRQIQCQLEATRRWCNVAGAQALELARKGLKIIGTNAEVQNREERGCEVTLHAPQSLSVRVTPTESISVLPSPHKLPRDLLPWLLSPIFTFVIWCFPVRAYFYITLIAWLIVLLWVVYHRADEIYDFNIPQGNSEGLYTESADPTHPTADPHNSLLVILYGSWGDINPMRFYARLAASWGVRTHVWIIKEYKGKELRKVADGMETSMVATHLRVLSAKAYGYRHVLSPFVSVSGGDSFVLMPSSKYRRNFNIGTGLWKWITNFYIETLTPTFRIGCLKDSTLPRSADGVTLLRRVHNTHRHPIGVELGSATDVKCNIAGAMPVPKGDHNLTMADFSTIYCHGGAGTMSTGIAAGATMISLDTAFDRDYRRPLTPEDFKQPTLAPFYASLWLRFSLSQPAPFIHLLFGLVKYGVFKLNSLRVQILAHALRIVIFLVVGAWLWTGPAVIFMSIPLLFELMVSGTDPSFFVGLVYHAAANPGLVLGPFLPWKMLIVLLCLHAADRFVHDVIALCRWETTLRFHKLGGYRTIWGHVSLAVPSTGEQFEGAFLPGVPRTLGAPFRWTERVTPSDHWLEIPFPFDPAALRRKAKYSDEKAYAPFWNCQTMAIGEGFGTAAVVPTSVAFAATVVVGFLFSVKTAVTVADYFGADLAQWRGEGQFAAPEGNTTVTEKDEEVRGNTAPTTDSKNDPTINQPPTDELLELTDALVAAEEGLKQRGWTEEEARKTVNRVGSHIMFEDSTPQELDVEQWSPPPGDTLGEWIQDFALWVGEYLVRASTSHQVFSDILKMAIDMKDRAIAFFQPVFDLLFCTGVLVATTAAWGYERLRRLVYRAIHFLFSTPLAIRGLKAAWGPAGIANSPYASLRYRLRSSMAMAEFQRLAPVEEEYAMQVQELQEARDMKDTNYEKLVERAWRHIPTSEAFGGHQSRPYRLQRRPVMSQQEKDQYEREAALLNIDLKAKIEPYFTERNKHINAPQAVDGAMLAAINPSVVLPSALRYLRDGVYNDAVPLMETDTLTAEDRRDADEVADAVFEQCPEAFQDPELRSEDHYITWMLRRGMMKYNTDSIINAQSRLHAYHDGLIEAAKRVSQKRMAEGIIRPMFFSVFPKSQPVQADPLFTPDATGIRKPVRTVYGENLTTIMQNARVGLEIKNRTPLPHWNMVSKTPAGQAYSRVFRAISTHQYAIEGDASQLDAHFQAFHMRMLDRMIERGVKDEVIARWLTIRNEVMRNSFAVMLTLPKGTSIPEYLRYGLAGTTEDSGNIFFKFRGGGTGEASTSWTDTWLMKPIMVRIMLDYAREMGLEWKASDFFNDEKSSFVNSGDDNVWGLTLPEGHTLDAATFQRCAHRRGFKLELGIYDDYRAVTFLGCKGRPPTKEDKLAMRDLAARFFNIETNPELTKYARINPDVVDPNTDSPPDIIVYRDLETTWIRRTAATRGRAMADRDDEYLFADIQKLEGHRLLTANLPSAYNAITEDQKVSLIRYLWAATEHPDKRRVHGFIRYPEGKSLADMEKIVGWNTSHKFVVRNTSGFQIGRFKELVKEIPWLANQPAKFQERLNRMKQLGLASYPKVLAIHYGCMPKSAKYYQEKYDKWFAHLVDFDAEGKEILDDLRKWSAFFDRKFANGLREVAPQMEWINRTPDVNINVAASIWLNLEAKAEKNAGSEGADPITLGEFVSVSKRGSFCIYDPVKFWYRMQDKTYADKIRKHPLWVYKNANWCTVIAYILMWFVERWLYSIPVLGMLYGFYMFMVVDMNKFYSVISCLFWLCTLDTSTTISSWFPRDPYLVSKIVSGTLTQAIPVQFYYLLPFAFLSDAIQTVVETITIAATRVQMLKPFAGTGATTNPWHYEADEIFEKMEENPDRQVAVQAPTGSGKSSDAVCAYLQHMQGDSAMSQGKIILLVPTKILLSNPFSPHLKMGADSDPVAMRRYQVLRRGVTPASHVKVYLMTYHHAQTRLNSGCFNKATDVVVMDEIHQGSPMQRLAVMDFSGWRVIMTTATPSPWKGLLPTLHVSRQKPRWTVSIKTFPDNLGMADMWFAAFKDHTVRPGAKYSPHQLSQRAMLLCATKREVEEAWHALNGLRNSSTGITPLAHMVGQEIIDIPPIAMVGSWIKPGSQQWNEREAAIKSGRYVLCGTKQMVTGFDAKPPPWFLACGKNIHQHRGALTDKLHLTPDEFTQAIGRLTRFSNDRDGLVYTHETNGHATHEIVEYPELALCHRDFRGAYDLPRLQIIPLDRELGLQPSFTAWAYFGRNPRVSLEPHVWRALEFITLLVACGLTGTELRSWYKRICDKGIDALSEDLSWVSTVMPSGHFPGIVTPSFDYVMAACALDPILWNVPVSMAKFIPEYQLFAAEPIVPLEGKYIRASAVGTKTIKWSQAETTPSDEATWAESNIARLEQTIARLEIQLKNSSSPNAQERLDLTAAVRKAISDKPDQGPWATQARKMVDEWTWLLQSPSTGFLLRGIPPPENIGWGHCNHHFNLFTINGEHVSEPSCGCQVLITNRDGKATHYSRLVRVCHIPPDMPHHYRRIVTATDASAIVRGSSEFFWTADSNRGSLASSGSATPLHRHGCDCPKDVPGLCAVDACPLTEARQMFHRHFGCARFATGWFTTDELVELYEAQGFSFAQCGPDVIEWYGNRDQAVAYDFIGDPAQGHWTNGRIIAKSAWINHPGFIDLGGRVPPTAGGSRNQGNTGSGPKLRTRSAHGLYDLCMTILDEGFAPEDSGHEIAEEALNMILAYRLQGNTVNFPDFCNWLGTNHPAQAIFLTPDQPCRDFLKPATALNPLSAVFRPGGMGGVTPPKPFQLRKTAGPRPLKTGPSGIDNEFMRELRAAVAPLKSQAIQFDPLIITPEQQRSFDLAAERKREEEENQHKNQEKIRKAMSQAKTREKDKCPVQ